MPPKATPAKPVSTCCGWSVERVVVGSSRAACSHQQQQSWAKGPKADCTQPTREELEGVLAALTLKDDYVLRGALTLGLITRMTLLN